METRTWEEKILIKKSLTFWQTNLKRNQELTCEVAACSRQQVALRVLDRKVHPPPPCRPRRPAVRVHTLRGEVGSRDVLSQVVDLRMVQLDGSPRVVLVPVEGSAQETTMVAASVPPAGGITAKAGVVMPSSIPAW